MKINKHFPSIFTLINLFLGFIAIINIHQQNYIISCYILFLAAAFDSIDGKLARMFGFSTDFGKEIDSLADMVSFCLAPAFLIYTLYTYKMPGIFGEFIASIPLIMGAIRLAQFNIIKEQPSHSFIGLPTPVNALAIVSLVLFIEHIKLVRPEFSPLILLISIIIILSYLMLSQIQYPKFPVWSFNVGKENNYRLFGVIFFIICLIIGIFMGYSYLVLSIFIVYYLLLGIIQHIINNFGKIKTKNQGI